MKWKSIYWLYLLIGIFAILPIGVYFYHYYYILNSTLSSNGQDWAAFGGMYYGLVIAGLTGFNIFVIKRNSQKENFYRYLKEQQLIYEEFLRIKFDLSQSLNKGEDKKLAKKHIEEFRTFYKSKGGAVGKDNLKNNFKRLNEELETINLGLDPETFETDEGLHPDFGRPSEWDAISENLESTHYTLNEIDKNYQELLSSISNNLFQEFNS